MVECTLEVFPCFECILQGRGRKFTIVGFTTGDKEVLPQPASNDSIFGKRPLLNSRDSLAILSGDDE
ncbi:hypothetical protein ACHAWC_007619 [Mediolabrus comicus]